MVNKLLSWGVTIFAYFILVNVILTAVAIIGFFSLLALAVYGVTIILVSCLLLRFSPEFLTWLQAQPGYRHRLSWLPGLGSASTNTLIVATILYLLPLSVIGWLFILPPFTAVFGTQLPMFLGLIGLGLLYGLFIHGWRLRQNTPSFTRTTARRTDQITQFIQHNRYIAILLVSSFAIPTLCTGSNLLLARTIITTPVAETAVSHTVADRTATESAPEQIVRDAYIITERIDDVSVKTGLLAQGSAISEPTAVVPTITSSPTAVSTATATATPLPTAIATPLPTATASQLRLPSGETISGDQATVVRIIDGDTIEVAIHGQNYRVRYIGMDTPERGDFYFDEATEANRQLVEGQPLLLVKDVSETDRYGRLLRYVYLADGTFVNAELVKQGFALVATFPPDVAHKDEFVALQEEARTTGHGLWAEAAAHVVAAIPATATATATATAVLPQPTATAVPPMPSPTQEIAPTAEPPTPEPVVAPGNVVISSIFYDGVVSRVESDEYAVVTNQGGSAINLAGWRLNAGNPGQDFNFPDFMLQPGQSCRVYTNQFHPESCGFSFGYGRAIWNNDGDCGRLYDNTGAEVSTYCY